MDDITEKNIILFVTIFIVALLSASVKLFKNDTFFFGLLFVIFLISFAQTKVLKKWIDKDKKDYNLIYFVYIFLDVCIFAFIFYMLYLKKGKQYIFGGLDGSMESEMTGGGDFNPINMYINFMRNGFTIGNKMIKGGFYGAYLLKNKIQEKLTRKKDDDYDI